MPLQIGVMQGSILDVDVQVIVNAANSYGIMGVAWQGSSGRRQEKENGGRTFRGASLAGSFFPTSTLAYGPG